MDEIYRESPYLTKEEIKELYFPSPYEFEESGETSPRVIILKPNLVKILEN